MHSQVSYALLLLTIQFSVFSGFIINSDNSLSILSYRPDGDIFYIQTSLVKLLFGLFSAFHFFSVEVIGHAIIRVIECIEIGRHNNIPFYSNPLATRRTNVVYSFCLVTSDLIISRKIIILLLSLGERNVLHKN
jgi:hypothetical protein